MPALQAHDVQAFGESIFEAYGVPGKDASLVSREVLRTHLMGYESHGIVRFVEYFADIEHGRINPGARSEVVRESGSTAVVDCGLNLGIVGAYAALTVALRKVRDGGIAMVVTRRCNHTGRLGAYPEAAARAGYLAIAGAAIPPRGHFVVPWGGVDGRLGTNPIAYAIPTGGDPVVSDFATSVLPEGKIRAARNRGDIVPPGAILDAEGRHTQDPNAFYGPPLGRMLPFGGAVGYKGYALGLMVELLGGALSGEWPADQTRPVNSMWLIVIDPDRFLDTGEFATHAAAVRQYMQSATPAAGVEKVRVPGDAAFERLRNSGDNPVVQIDDETWRQLADAGRRMDVPVPTALQHVKGE